MKWSHSKDRRRQVDHLSAIRSEQLFLQERYGGLDSWRGVDFDTICSLIFTIREIARALLALLFTSLWIASFSECFQVTREVKRTEAKQRELSLILLSTCQTMTLAMQILLDANS